VEDRLIFEWDFVSNKLQKIEFGRKNQLSPQCVHTWANSTGYTSRSYSKRSYVYSSILLRKFHIYIWGVCGPTLIKYSQVRYIKERCHLPMDIFTC
jgi:hypothetical protein